VFSDLGTLRAHDELYVAIQHLEEAEQLVDRLPVVRLIQQSVELRRGGSEPTDDLALGQRRGGDALLGFERQPIHEQIAQGVGILVVLENVLDVDGPLLARPESIREALCAQLAVDVHARNGILRRWPQLEEPGIRKHQPLPGCQHLEGPASIVRLHAANLHSRPSASIYAINWRTLAAGVSLR